MAGEIPNYSVPGYLQHVPDLGAQMIEGYRAGSAVALAQQKLEQESQRTQIELAVEQKRQQQEDARHQQQLEQAKAYHEQQTLLKKQQLDQQQQKIQAQTQQAAARFQAQQRYQQRFQELGSTPEAARQAMMELGPALGTSAGGMAALTRPQPGKPLWVPPDAKTGAPGYMQSGTGAIHIPPSQRPQGQLGPRDVLNTLRQREQMLAKDKMLNFPITKDTDPAFAKQVQDKRTELEQTHKRIEAILSQSGQGDKGSSGKLYKNKKGQKLRYKGEHENPPEDTDEANWEVVE